MTVFEVKGDSIDEIHSRGKEFLLIWVLLHEGDDWRSSPLWENLTTTEFTDIPSCALVVNMNDNPWAKDAFSSYDGGIALIPHCGGFGVNLISKPDEFSDKCESALHLARQAKSNWEKESEKTA